SGTLQLTIGKCESAEDGFRITICHCSKFTGICTTKEWTQPTNTGQLRYPESHTECPNQYIQRTGIGTQPTCSYCFQQQPVDDRFEQPARIHICLCGYRIAEREK